MMLALLLAVAPPVVGVLEFRDKVPAEQHIDAAYLSDQVRSAVKELLPEARVITRENMLILLKSTGKTLEECEGECEVETGRRIGADLVVSGELLRFGSQYKLRMELHDTRSGELLSASVAAGATADELDRDLHPAVGKLLAPLLQDQISDRRSQASQIVEVRERRLPSTAAAIWLTAGIAGAFSSSVFGDSSRADFATDLGGHLFFRVVGPLYLGTLLDYSLSGPTGLLAAGGARLALPPVAVSAGVGYADLAHHAGDGLGGIAAIDIGLISGFALRLQACARQGRMRATRLFSGVLVTVPVKNTVFAGMGGLSLQF